MQFYKKVILIHFLTGFAHHWSLSGQTGCIDMAKIVTEPVQCYSFRDGTILIDSVQGGTPPYYYSIDRTTFSTRPVFDRLWPGTYTVTIRDSFNCVLEEEVIVEEPPVLTVQLTAPKRIVSVGEPFELFATITPSGAPLQSVHWRPPEYFANSNLLTQMVTLSETTTFAIEIINDKGCTARHQLVIEVNPPDIFIPNVIVPGSNEDALFTVFSDDYVSQVRSLQVYSRSGGLVFERLNFPPNDPLLGWNGRLRGRRVQEGVYTWVAQLEYVNGKVHTRQGSITVLK